VSVSSVERRGTLPASARRTEVVHEVGQVDHEGAVVEVVVELGVQEEALATTVESPVICQETVPRSVPPDHSVQAVVEAVEAEAAATSAARKVICRGTALIGVRAVVGAVQMTASVTTVERVAICRATVQMHPTEAVVAEGVVEEVVNASRVDQRITFRETVLRRLPDQAVESLTCAVTTATRWVTCPAIVLWKLRSSILVTSLGRACETQNYSATL